MSLINDALKKAQRQRTEGSTPPDETSVPNSATEPLQRVIRREKPAGFRSQLMLIAGGVAAVVVVLALGAMYIFRPSAQPAAMPKSAPIASTSTAVVAVPPTTQPAPAAVAAPAAIVPAATAPLTKTVPAIPAPPPQPLNTATATSPEPAPAAVSTPVAPAATPVQFALPTPATTVVPSVASPAPTTSSPVVPERPKPSARMIAVIEHFRVGGIRVSGGDSKVLMNDKVYRLNETVDYELNIRLTGIEPKALTFEDDHGAIYTRNF